MRDLPRRSVVTTIRIYQKLVSPGLGRNCRYAPTCSQYTIDAISRFGVVKGAILGARRVGRCHPLRSGGYDPVPEQWSER